MSDINKRIAKNQKEIMNMLSDIENSLIDSGNENNNWTDVAETERLLNDLKHIIEYRK